MIGDRKKNVAGRQNGMLYLTLLLSIALLGLGLSAFNAVWWLEARRDKENELIMRGLQIRDAIGSYYEMSPGTVKKYPRSLEQLVQDDRYLYIQRHLRKIPIDPITNSTSWKSITSPDGGIMGVSSLSTGTPMMTASAQHAIGVTPIILSGGYFAGWRFVYLPSQQQTLLNGGARR